MKRMKKLVSAVLTGAMLLSCTAALAVTAEETPVELKPYKMYGVTVADGVASGIPGTPTVAELRGMFDESEAAISVSAGDAVLADDAFVPNGATISNGSESATAIIYGDNAADGKLNLSDVSALLKYIAKWDVVLK